MGSFSDESVESISSASDVKLIRKEEKRTQASKKANPCCTSILLVCGVINIIIGILAMHFDFVDVIIEEKMRMRPGLPPFDWWKAPPVDVMLTVYLFNVTNAESFLNGTDSKLKVQEVGPIVYIETVRQNDIVFHENSTMTYTTTHSARFSPENSPPGILNQTITVPNAVLLGMVGSIYESSFLKKVPFNIASRKDTIFLNETVYNVLWNFTTPVLELAKNIVPFMVPRENGGILYNVYYKQKCRLTVNIGDKYGSENFFKINNLNGFENIPQFKGEHKNCTAISVNGARDGTSFPPYMTKESTFRAWRIGFCTTLPFRFEEEVQKNGMEAYKYVLKPNEFDRTSNLEQDCLRGETGNELPDGLSDMSACAFGTPQAISFPHFWGRSGRWEDDIEGMHPNQEKHQSFSIIEPRTGIALQQVGRLQNNIVMPKLNGFNSEVQKFSGKIIPTFWAEYKLEELPSHMVVIVNFVVNKLPVLQPLIGVLCFVLGALCIVIILFKLSNVSLNKLLSCQSPKKSALIVQANNKLMRETEEFLTKKV